MQNPKKVGKIEGKRVKRHWFLDHGALLKKLKAAQDNLSFSPAFMKAVCEEVGERHQAKWKHSPQDTQEFAATMGPRLRVLCRQFQQNMIKPQPPKWAVEVLKGPSQTGLEKKPTAAAAAADPLAEVAETSEESEDEEGEEEEVQEEEEEEAEEDLAYADTIPVPAEQQDVQTINIRLSTC